MAAPLLIVTVRFSVVTAQRESWLIGRNKSAAEYQKDLFNDERLRLHHHLFATVTLPSLEAQVPTLSDNRFRLYAITSSDLPRQYALALDELISQYSWARVKRVPSDAKQVPHDECIAEFLSDVGHGQGSYVHVRLDDDDALAADFIERIAGSATSENVGKAVSLAKGYAALFDSTQGGFTSVIEYRSPMAAQGLSYIGAYKECRPVGRVANVYALGNHLRVDTRVPVILDSRFPAFLRTYHKESDVQVSSSIKFPTGETVTQSELSQRFPSIGHYEHYG